MLDHLHIQNYRLFKDLKIDKLGQVNLIAGKNNTGKTALLEALRIWDSNANINVLTNILFNRNEIINKEPTNGYNLFRDVTDGIIKIGDFVKNEYVKFAIELELENKKEGVLCPFQYGINGDGTGYDVFKNVVFLPLTSTHDLNISMWGKINLFPEEKDVENIIKIMVPNIQRIGLSDDKFMILTSNYPFPIPLKKLGDGANRLFTIALALVIAKNKMLLIDEFEVGLHHSVQEQLWEIIFKYAKEWNIQVFVTTHSQDTVKAFAEVWNQSEENIKMGNYFRLQQSRENPELIEPIYYDNEMLEFAYQKHIETR